MHLSIQHCRLNKWKQINALEMRQSEIQFQNSTKQGKKEQAEVSEHQSEESESDYEEVRFPSMLVLALLVSLRLLYFVYLSPSLYQDVEEVVHMDNPMNDPLMAGPSSSDHPDSPDMKRMRSEKDEKENKKETRTDEKKKGKKKVQRSGKGAVISPSTPYKEQLGAPTFTAIAGGGGGGGDTKQAVSTGAVGGRELRYEKTFEADLVMNTKRDMCNVLQVISNIRVDYRLSRMLFMFKQHCENPVSQQNDALL